MVDDVKCKERQECLDSLNPCGTQGDSGQSPISDDENGNTFLTYGLTHKHTHTCSHRLKVPVYLNFSIIKSDK